MKPERCQATAASGKPCSATPRPGRPFCLWHDPDAEDLRRELSKKGGTARSNKARARKQIADGALSPAEVHGLLCTTLKGVIAGRIEPGVGNAAANLARALTEVGRAAEIAERLDDLERQQAILRGAS